MASDAEISVIAKLEANISDFMTKMDDAVVKMQETMKKASEAANEGGEKVTEGLNKVAKESRKAGEESGKNFGEGLKLMLAAVATTFLDQLHEAFGEASEMAERLKNAAAQTGDSPEGVQKLGYAFATTGLSISEATNSIVMFQRRIADAASSGTGKSIFSRVGLDPAQMAKNTGAENIALIAEKMRNLSNATERSQLSMAAFGLTGERMIPILMKGGDGLKELEGEANAAGAVLSGPAVEALDSLREKLNQLGATKQVFNASFIAPFADAFERVADSIQRVYAAFVHLADDTKLAVIFGTVTAVVGLAAEGFEAFRPILGSLVSKEVLDSLLNFSGFITRIVTVVGILGVAWATNFGGMRVFVGQVIIAIEDFFQHAMSAFNAIAQSAQSIVGPSFERLSSAIKDVLIAIGDMLEVISSNNDAWSLLEDAANVVLKVLSVLIDIATRIINVFKNGVGPALTGVAVILSAVFLPAVLAAATAVLEFVAYEVIMRVALFGQAILDLIPKIQAMWFAWIAGEDIAFPPLLIFQVILVAVGAAILAIGANWNTIGPIVYMWLSHIEDWVVKVNLVLADWLEWLAKLLKVVPFMGGMADAIQKIADNTRDAAGAAEDAAVKYFDLANAMKTGAGQADLGNASFGTWKDKEPEPGKDHIATGKKEKEKDTNSEALRALEEALFKYQEAIRQTQNSLSELKLKQEALGKIGTPAELNEWSYLEERIIGKQHLLAQQQRDEAQQDLRNAAAAKRLIHPGAKAGTPQARDNDADIAAVYKYRTAAMNAFLASDTSQQKAKTDEIEMYAKQVAFYKTQSGDKDLSFKVREAALVKSIALETLNIKMTDADRVRQHREFLAIREEELKQALDLQKAKDDVSVANIEAVKSVRDATPLDKENPNAAHYRAIVDAQGAVDAAQARFNDAHAAVTAADTIRMNAENAQRNAPADQRPNYDALVAEATVKDSAAIVAGTQATAALTVAQLALKQATLALTPAQQAWHDGLQSIIAQIAGPFMAAIKNIQNGMNPLAALFLALFQKSASFNDIMIIMGKVVDQVARIFDAMRPIIDFLLGILVGLVNVFLSMYNIIVKVLDVLGLQIKTIKLVTDNLLGMNQAVPLLQVTHDIPTMNQLNTGKIGDLVAKQDATNSLLAGFNQQFANLGQMAGTLLGIYALVKIITTYMALKEAGGIGGAIGNAFPFLAKFFGGGGSLSTPGGSSSIPGMGRSDTTDIPASTPAAAVTSVATPSSIGVNLPAAGSGGSSSVAGMGTFDTTDMALTQSPADFQAGMTTAVQNVSALQTTAANTGGINAMSTGMKDSLAGMAGNIVGGLVNKAMGGNATDAAALGGLGGAVGAIFGGPLGSAIGSFAGEVIGGMFGPHYNDNKNPDITNATINGEPYGQAIANLTGSQNMVANNQTYAAQSGDSFLQQISSYIAAGGKGLSANLLKEFTGATGIVNGKNGILDLANGVNLQWQQLVNDANTAMAQIANGGNKLVTATATLFSNATHVDITSLYGNGTSVTAAGGVAANQNVTAGNQSLGNSQLQPASFVVNIAAVHGTDAGAITKAFQPVFAEYARQSQIIARTQASAVGRGGL